MDRIRILLVHLGNTHFITISKQTFHACLYIFKIMRNHPILVENRSSADQLAWNCYEYVECLLMLPISRTKKHGKMAIIAVKVSPSRGIVLKFIRPVVTQS
ncbi:MAG: hypothetical protein CMM35_10430 [Rhodospirillaceae bacterium]|jgi:hypothetical protein|nr:hypothetical protein [Rhodospirillaceae bacterium]|tara:strand:+ start:173 stop:475 length:303 start_codon:yes stop_codon:yes gene_type:complete